MEVALETMVAPSPVVSTEASTGGHLPQVEVRWLVLESDCASHVSNAQSLFLLLAAANARGARLLGLCSFTCAAETEVLAKATALFDLVHVHGSGATPSLADGMRFAHVLVGIHAQGLVYALSSMVLQFRWSIQPFSPTGERARSRGATVRVVHGGVPQW